MITRSIRIRRHADVARVVLHAWKLGLECGLDTITTTLIATSASELAQNIINHAESGVIYIRMVCRDGDAGIEVIAVDRGPGIADVTAAMGAHFSTSGTLGLGLPGVERMMDELAIETDPASGTRVTARKWHRVRR